MTAYKPFKDKDALFTCLQDMVVATASAVRPAERLTVTEAGERYHYISNKTYTGPWSREKTPYMVEVQDGLTSLEKTGTVFVGPARTGKSLSFLNWLTYTAKCDPADMMIIQMNQGRAREWSQDDLAKFLRYSDDIRKLLVPGRTNDNVYDKTFLSGMRLTIKHPTIAELSGKTIPRLWIMDYDREPINIDGEGDKWSLTKKRSQTFKRHGMTVAESSPGCEVLNAKWSPQTPHQAPPTEGILALYNTGDRRRWYWSCPQCNDKFEPDWKLLTYPDSQDFHEAAEAVTLTCPHCGFPMLPDMQYELNLGGRWIADGQQWLPSGEVIGSPPRSDIASYWLKGPAAAYTTWPELVVKYLEANKEYEDTGSEEKLKAVTNTDFGLPYTYKALENGRLPETLKARAIHWSDEPTVPTEAGGGFLVATVDVQARSFVVHVYLVSAGNVIWHVDMFKIRKSARIDEDGHPYPIDPAGFKEDWHLLIDQVIHRTYPLNDGSSRRMAIKISGCDSGGKDGVTANAYDFYRHLQTEMLHQRFHLLKGNESKGYQDTAMRPAMWDSLKKDKFSVARGDIPGWLVSSNFVKDAVNTLLEAPDRVKFPKWAPDWLYSQLTAEVRDPGKGWLNTSGKRNESFDLICYCYALLTHPDIRAFHQDWSNPPSWMDDFDRNDFVYDESGQPAFMRKVEGRKSISELGDALG